MSKYFKKGVVIGLLVFLTMNFTGCGFSKDPIFYEETDPIYILNESQNTGTQVQGETRC